MGLSRGRVLQFVPVVGLAVVVAAGWVSSPAALLSVLDRYSWLHIAGGLAVLYLVRPFFLWPLSVFSVYLGYLLGFPAGVPAVLAGTVVTCVPPFLLAEHVQRAGGVLGSVSDAGERVLETTGELRGVVAARLSPAPADAVSVGAGLAGVSPAAFAVGTLLGELPWAVFYVTLGHSIRSFSRRSVTRGDIWFLLVTSLCAAAVLAGPAYRQVTARE